MCSCESVTLNQIPMLLMNFHLILLIKILRFWWMYLPACLTWRMHHFLYAECISLITRNFNSKLPYLMFGLTYYHQFILLNWLSYKNTVVPLKVVEKYRPLGASISLVLKILVFNTLKCYFIYFNIQFHNIFYISSLNFSISQTLFIFLFIFFLSSSLLQNPTHGI